MNIWTKEEIEKVFQQLDLQSYPFKKYQFSKLGNGLELLGKGGFANVYEAKKRNSDNKTFAIKVIGFGEKDISCEEFRREVQIQKDGRFYSKNIIKIFDYIELRVWFDENNDLMKVEELEEEIPCTDERCIDLHFVVMEKLIPILRNEGFGKYVISPERLLESEEEVFLLARDIGNVLQYAHELNVLHRDIKLENVFYSEKENCYKLGDFGIAKATKDGMASTIMFTKGYAAPEIVRLTGNRYDNTADVYSFGIMLYLLLNGLCFPESMNYQADLNIRYSKTFVFPNPRNASTEFADIVLKMCQYNPDNRYQSIEEMLTDLNQMKWGTIYKYRKNHLVAPMALSIITGIGGACIGKMSFAPSVKVDLSVLLYLYFSLCIVRVISVQTKKKNLILDCSMFAFSIVLLIIYGISIQNIILLFIFDSGMILSVIVCGSILAVSIVSQFTWNIIEVSLIMANERWIAIFLLFLSVFLLLYYQLLTRWRENVYFYRLRMNWYWSVITFAYLMEIGYAYFIENGNSFFQFLIDQFQIQKYCTLFLEMNPYKIGICGIIFSLFWIAREKYLFYFEDRK